MVKRQTKTKLGMHLKKKKATFQTKSILLAPSRTPAVVFGLEGKLRIIKL